MNYDKQFRKRNRNREWRVKERVSRQKHHLIPRNRGGSSSPNNLFLIWNERHDIWHHLFGNATIDEAIAILYRIKRAKRF